MASRRSSATIKLILVLTLIQAGNVTAQLGTAGAALRLGVGARAKAMGDAYGAIARGIESSYYNPAGLPFLEKKEAIASVRLLSLGRQYTFLGFGLPIQPKVAGGKQAINGGLALSWIRASVGDIDGRDTDGRPIGNLSNSENAFALSFALKPTQKLAVGLSVKVVWNRFPDIGDAGETISASGVGFDFGALLTPTSWISLGVTIKDINSKYRWNTQDLYGEDAAETVRIDKFPKGFRTAVAVRIPQLTGVTVAFDFQQYFKSKLFKERVDDRVHIGAEWMVAENLAARAGFDDGSLTAGGGYGFSFFGKPGQLNYSYSAPGDRPEGEHVFTWVFQF